MTPLRAAACLLALIAAPLAGQETAPVGAGDPFAPLLAAAGVAPGEDQLEPKRWRDGGRLSLEPLFGRLWDDWRAIAPWAEELGRGLVAAGERGDLAAVVSLAAAPLGPPLADDEPPPLEPDGRRALETALRGIHALFADPVDDGALAAFLDAAPPEVEAVAAAVLVEVPGVLAAQRRALAPWDDASPAAVRSEALGLARFQVDDESFARLEAMDGPALALAARRLARGLDRARAAALRVPAAAAIAHPTSSMRTDRRARYLATWTTPLGDVVLAGPDDDDHAAVPRLLLVDAGGDDRHPLGAATSTAVPISVLVDLAGDDLHGDATTSNAGGAGVAGCAAVLDLAGDDRYAARRFGVGCGLLGVGLVVDVKGRDRYRARHHGDAAATAGLGLVIDLAGDDLHEGLERVQGLAQTRAVALLLDVAGDDRYLADDQVITNPSPQSAEHNTSLAQGCGFGRRAHPGDGRSLAGGVGLLVDGRGSDRYRAGVFGQGVGYWYAIGALVDLAGDDDGEAAWYGQGAAAHYAIGVHVDVAGDDRHAVTLTQGVGHGHDYSIGVLVDEAGNDRYACPSNALGAALWNGLGVLDDRRGEDSYSCGASYTLGDGGSSQNRPEHRSLGLFLDRGGRDRFPEHLRARPGALWVSPPGESHPRALGAGRSVGGADSR